MRPDPSVGACLPTDEWGGGLPGKDVPSLGASVRMLLAGGCQPWVLRKRLTAAAACGLSPMTTV